MSITEEPSQERKKALFKLELEVRLHGKLCEEEWEDLVHDHYVAELLEGTLSCSEVADRVRHLRQVYGQRGMSRDRSPRKPSKQDKEPENLKVLSLLVAEEAAQDMGVQAFRTKVLGGQYLSLHEVSNWIKEKAGKDGLPTWWLMNVPLPSNEIHYDEITTLTSERVFQHHIELHIPQLPLPLGIDVPLSECVTFRFLCYREPGSDDIKEIPTTFNGISEDLRQLSERLAEEYAWTAADATLFILTNTAPEIRPLTSTSQSRQLPALSRIVLTIDPALSPQEVAEHYRQLRQEIMPARHRDLSEKHLQLAAFSGTHPRLGTWQQKMMEWNSIYRDWAYKEASNFAHDCLQARRRVLRSN